ncbi:unnamed protein product [Anisakis simplex]|uniref:Dimer_Tnp_hAT domain-containing protein n=1 Tax=Anisakis simplex TaxID=6269 RepID=A0A0M3JXJ8_ANISI|nr:unnamed protein product [Anisakis simplex]
MRCAAHTWNLIATKDSEKVLDKIAFKKAYRSALAKAKALWNRQNQSTITANALHKELGVRLIVPSDTRWNSFYDAIVCLNKVVETKRANLRRAMIQQGLTAFSEEDYEFWTEYAHVMNPVATAIDVVQSDEGAYLGWLLPVCATASIKLNEIKNSHLFLIYFFANRLSTHYCKASGKDSVQCWIMLTVCLRRAFIPGEELSR